MHVCVCVCVCVCVVTQPFCRNRIKQKTKFKRTTFDFS